MSSSKSKPKKNGGSAAGSAAGAAGSAAESKKTDRGLGRLSKWNGNSIQDFATLLIGFDRVVVMFSGDFCEPCKPVAEKLNGLANANPGIHFVKLETNVSFKDDDPIPQLFDAYDVTNVPTLKLFRHGELISTWNDAEQSLSDWLAGKKRK